MLRSRSSPACTLAARQVVAHGTVADANDDGGADPYEVPKALGIFREIPSRSPQLTVDNIVGRIQVGRKIRQRDDLPDWATGRPAAGCPPLADRD